MAIFVEDEKPFEAGTTVTSKVRITDQDGDATQADLVDSSQQMTLEVKDGGTGNTVRAEENMDAKTDSDGNPYYQDQWVTSEGMELGQYYLVHRAQVGGDPFKMTRIVKIVDAKERDL